MAKQPSSKGGTSRIRFIMLDAEIPDGQLADVTAAIQNALKPNVIMQTRMPMQAPQAAQIVDARVNGEGLVEGDEDSLGDEDAAAPKTVASQRPRKPAKPSSPKFLNDLDLTSQVSFQDYVAQYPPETDPDRNLVVAAYFQEHRPDHEGVTKDYVYTCYRMVK